MNISKSKLKEMFESDGYYIDDSSLSKAYVALEYFIEKKNVGQDVYSLCLDGPSGAGKTSFVDAYRKVASELLKQPVKFINFQLDGETGKTDLYEDIDIVAAISDDPDKVRLAGAILKAFQLVNQGNYVVLKMDEYDKARDSTDTFFNNVLQEGLLNTVQHGDVQIAPENLGKLQVFLCKNDMRAELSEPMIRRNRIIRLDYMKPDRMFLILEKFANDYQCDSGLLNLVLLMYENMYQNREVYRKLPSCSECKQAIMDAHILLRSTGFSKTDIYQNIIDNMLKFEDDIKTFESQVGSSKNDKLSSLIDSMKDAPADEDININSLIAQKIFTDEGKNLAEKTQEMNALIQEYREKFALMEEQRKEAIEQEIQRISLEHGTLVSTVDYPKALRNFEDESARIKRGYNIFELSPKEWTDVGSVYFDGLSHHDLIQGIIKYVNQIDTVVYENGIVLKEDKDNQQELIVIYENDPDGNLRYRIMSSQAVIPSTFVADIKHFLTTCNCTYQLQEAKPTKNVVNSALNMSMGRYSIDTLIYNDTSLDMDEISSHVYHFTFADQIFEPFSTQKLDSNLEKFSCSNIENATNASTQLMKGKTKQITYGQ